ncbi:ABC transporter ATP-binding protein [Gloeobacter kilaueensis]|uniref:ABC transporter n=1 Tax=Gloeobacter kilaueensis (strain ATCC BAA-2537 / CCAP 1431/1 / ULC 316 / JS1) TaxID=1183438 RepID=U5QIH2_GLOK1|nr:ABC transporter ATP-binding protein [Gloeobacter kilaueensis]AGY58731.1 ABC transporter [Gloeobacter kilaueensis JS1]
MAWFLKSYHRLLPFLAPHRLIILAALGCTAGFVATTPLLAYMVGRLTKFFGDGDLRSITELAWETLGVFIVRGLFQFGQDTLMAKAALDTITDLRAQVYAHLQKLDLACFASQRTGDLTMRLTGDIDRLGEIVRRFFYQFVPCVLTIVAVVSYLIFLNWQLTLVTMIIAPGIGWLFGWFGTRLSDLSRTSQDQIADLSSMLFEIFSAIRIIRAFAAEDYEKERFVKLSDENRLARFRTEQIKAVQYPIIGLLQALSVLLVFWVGTWQISLHNLSAEQFASFAAGIGLLLDPVRMITENLNELRQADGSADRVFELFELMPTVLESPKARVLAPVQGRIELQNINFAYTDGRQVLNGVNLQIEPGEVVALVGPSGSGKSSLVNLLPRFYDPLSGTVSIDGIDVRNVTFASLRRQIGIVPQETLLFSGTVAQNIAYGCNLGPEELPDEVIEAAKIANAHEFIMDLPNGYRTQMSEGGRGLSGGQRQRIAIARAVLLDPKILILDEATSALDNESEALVQAALDRLMKMKGRTVIIVAHRLSTIRDADRILVLDRGQIIEEGNHLSLLAGGKVYASLYNRQFERTPA